MNKIAFVLTGARAPLARLFLTLTLTGALAGAVLLGSGCSDDKGTATYPEADPPQSMNWLFDVYGTGPDDVYAAGNKGAMFHYDGNDSNHWEPVSMGVSSAIVTLWADGGTMYAVGHGGKIWNNTAGTWNSMASGVTKDLYGIGKYNDQIYAVGAEGTLRRLSGGSWGTTPSTIVLRDPATGEPDTNNILDRTHDLSSLLAVNHYFIGGAYWKPDFTGERVSMLGSDGMVLTTDLDPQYDWLLRPIRGDQLADAEWVLSMTSNPLVLGQNYLGTSEGWLFQLTQSPTGRLVWVKHYPRITYDPGSGIRDMWLDEDQNVFVVTDDGQLVKESANYDYAAETGYRVELYRQVNALVSIWGTDSSNFYMTGFVENKIFHGSMVDSVTVEITEIPVTWPAKAAGGIDPFTDELGRPRF